MKKLIITYPETMSPESALAYVRHVVAGEHVGETVRFRLPARNAVVCSKSTDEADSFDIQEESVK